MSSGFVTEAEVGINNYKYFFDCDQSNIHISRWRRRRSKGKMSGKGLESPRILLR